MQKKEITNLGCKYIVGGVFMRKKKVLIISLFLISIFLVSKRIFLSVSQERQVQNFLASSKFLEDVDNQEDLGDSYIALLEIPKIHLQQGMYSMLSKENTVAKNIEIIEGSTMPDQENSHLILAAHSGTSAIAYFKNLDKLVIGDRAYIYYKNMVYTYKLINIYQEKKDGVITVRWMKDNASLTLITCNKRNNQLQDVYLFQLVDLQ